MVTQSQDLSISNGRDKHLIQKGDAVGKIAISSEFSSATERPRSAAVGLPGGAH